MKNSALNLMLWGCVTLFSASSHAAELKFNTQDFPPFSYMVDGVVSGPAVDVIQQVCKEISIKCSFSLFPWARAQANVKEGQAQALFLIGRSEERENWLYFSPPIVETAYGFFVHADDLLEYRKPFDLVNYTVGVFGPSNTASSLEKIRDQMGKDGLQTFKVEVRPDDESGFLKLAGKRVQAVYSNRDVGTAMLAKLGVKNVRFAGTSETIKYYIGFAKANVTQEQVDQFDTAFRKLHEDGVIAKILAKYGMADVPHKSWDKK